eukprot:gene41625-63170_t
MRPPPSEQTAVVDKWTQVAHVHAPLLVEHELEH